MRGKDIVLSIAIVGPCAAGKSTLAHALQSRGLGARQIAQEHSYAPSMWQHLSRPDLLIFLDASYEVCTQRKNLNWLPRDYTKQVHRLEHARKHCHIYVNTDGLTPEEVLEQVLTADVLTLLGR